MTLTEATTAEVSRELAQAVFRLAACVPITTDQQATEMGKALQLARAITKRPEQPRRERANKTASPAGL